MKKFFALVLIVCMMMTAVALAEKTPVQDQQPPKAIEAKLYDAQGNEIAEIKEEELVLTDVHFRAEVERLTAAYEGVMSNVHFSDVACALHEHAVKVDIDEVLAAIDAEFDAHDLVMAELFEIALADASVLTDGAYMEITLEGAPVVALFTADGASWEMLDFVSNGETFTVKLTRAGVMALFADGRQVIYVGETTEEVVETVVPGAEGGDAGIHFDNFTPSASGKPAPEVVPFPGVDGEDYVATIINAVGEVITMVPNRNYIIITAVSECDFTTDILTYEHLKANFGDALNVENVGMLISAAHEGTIAAELEAALKAMNLDLTCDQLVIKDLFEVSAYGDYVEHLYGEDARMEVAFNADLDAGKPLIVLHSADSVNWNVLPAEDVKVNGDGTVTLKLAELGAVAFVVEAEAEPEAAVQSPN